jgi:Holliday junction resolvase
MIDAPRPKGKYVYPTWITKLLAEENKCWYSAWYKAALKYEKRPDDPERAEFFRTWTAKHDAITQRRAAELRREGWTVKVEEEGEFRVRGKNGTISGKPDIVAMRGDDVLVVDAKSGRPRQSDHWQVLLYVLLLPMDWLKGFTGTVKGEVEYENNTVFVRPLTDKEKTKITDALKLVTGGVAPDAVPSQGDCRYCDIAQCKFRYQASEGEAGGAF